MGEVVDSVGNRVFRRSSHHPKPEDKRLESRATV